MFEIERKFLVKDDNWKEHVVKELSIKQGSFVGENKSMFRLRICGQQAIITLKGPATPDGLSRPEVEFDVVTTPEKTANVFALCTGTLRKTRYLVPHEEEADLFWEIDVFLDNNSGLIVAEIELDSPDREFSLPQWIGEEVTHDARYLNANLVKKPFLTW